MMEFPLPFPDGEMSHKLKMKGWQESDIMDIRNMLIKEIKRQNEKEVQNDKI